MIIFAIDSSTSAGSAAVWQDGKVLYESYADLGTTHSETLMQRCDEVFKKSGIAPDEIDYYAVTSGPGSFTGLRIGMGTIKGFAFAAGKPCVAVPTLEAMAYNVLKTDRIAVSVLDARRGRVYVGAFGAKEEVIRLEPDRVEEIENLNNIYSGKKIILIGDAAAVCYNRLHENIDCTVADDDMLLPRASGVAGVAAKYIKNGRAVSAASISPEYIQMPQAQRELMEKNITGKESKG